MNPQEITLSFHVVRDRQDRLTEINAVLDGNWGISAICAWNEERNNWQFLTNTGLMVFISKDKSCIITMYLPTISQVYRLCDLAGVALSLDLKKRLYANNKRLRQYQARCA